MSDSTSHPFHAYLRKLADLSANNRSLFLPRLRSSHFLDMHSLGTLHRKPSFSLVEAALQRKKKALCSVVDSRVEFSNEISKKLKQLHRAEKTIYEECGTRDLHIGWPFVRGKFISAKNVRCPLLLIPVTLVLERDTWAIKPREGAYTMFNKFFLLAYSFHNRVPVDKTLLEETFEDVDRDGLTFRTALYELLKNSFLDIHFNADTYRDQLIPFEKFLKKDFEAQYENGRLKLFPEAILGIFPQAGSYLAPDYMALIEQDKGHNMDAFFLSKHSVEKNTSFASQRTPRVEERKTFVGYPQDAWQENVLMYIKSGYSIIAKGPPGTGKSQLICNIICDAIATKKRVLMVCQKRAALDVVYTRLKSVNLNEFVALVHDFKHDRKEVYAKAANQIGHIEPYTTENNRLDSIQTERKFIQASNRIDQITHELDQFKRALFDDSECGMSIKELYLLSKPDKPSVNITQEYKNFPLHSIDPLIVRLSFYSHYAQQFEKKDYLWRLRKPFVGFTSTDAKKIENIIKAIPALVQKLCDQLQLVLGTSITREDLLSLYDAKKSIEAMPEYLINENVYKYFQSMMTQPDKVPDLTYFIRQEETVRYCLAEEGIEKTVSTDRLDAVYQALCKALNIQGKGMRTMWWHFFSKERPMLQKILFENRLKNDKEGLMILEKKLSRRIRLETVFAELEPAFMLTSLRKDYYESAVRQWFAHQQKAIRAAQVFAQRHCLQKVLRFDQITYASAMESLRTLLDAIDQIVALQKEGLVYLQKKQIRAFILNHDHCSEAVLAIKRDFDALCEFDTLKAGFSVDEQSVVLKIHQQTGTWEHLDKIFINSLYLAWIDHIEEKFPVLKTVSSGKMKLLEKELEAQIREKQKTSNQIILMQAREGVIDKLEFNQMHNRVTYRDLLHQLSKKRKIWPMRKLVASFEEEIFRLLPCWMASPESVSAIFPLKEMFDIVIFDEASQCFAEHAIPAMYRGRQLLIAGDDKQLRPNDLYRIRWQEEEENPDVEVDSLLALAARHLKQLPLCGHYRSRSLSLIDFSNRYFYNGKLTFVPRFSSYANSSPAIVYRKVEGVWEHNTNVPEAREIVDLVIDLVQHNPTREIGIVTFNAPQQTLIMDFLEEAFAQKNEPLPPSLIVKNIENIQGDEKDIIIFSVGYAPGKNARFNMQFGNLNAEGGQNRLNVAITRARERVIVVTSIYPHQLHVDGVKNEGPKLLKKYLQYAHSVAERKFIPHKNSENKDKKRFSGSLGSTVLSWGEQHFANWLFRDDELPFADISAHLKSDDKKVHLILTDDDLYRQNPSAKDFHVFVPSILQQNNWCYMRLYSRDYWQNRNAFFECIKQNLLKQDSSTGSI